MTIETFRDYCLSKPHTTEELPFGPDTLVFKVGGKIFALVGLDEEDFKVNLKCDPQLAIELREAFEYVKAGYHMNKKHWNTVQVTNGASSRQLRDWTDHSYFLVFESLPKKIRENTPQ
jgi:predicted DNA-binding protein (MmcQ/YjbR family)